MRSDDGTFDIVISTDARFVTRYDVGSVETLLTHVRVAADHLGWHGSGHAALRLRSEDSDIYQDVDGLDNGDAACDQPLAAHVDDNRIERYTAIRAASPLHVVDHIAAEIAYLHSELNDGKHLARRHRRCRTLNTPGNVRPHPRVRTPGAGDRNRRGRQASSPSRAPGGVR